MSTKTKNIKNNAKGPADKLAEVAQQAGVVLMTAAVTLGMMEVPDHGNRIVLPNQPVFELAGNSSESSNPNSLRREREETGPHYISYNVSQRTPGRTGKA